MREASALQGFETNGREDAIREAMVRLRTQLRRASDDPVRVELLEDDLREGLRTVEDVRGFFDDVLALLVNPDTRGRDLVDLADDAQVVNQLDYLVVLVNNLRRRLMQLANRASS